MSTTHDLKCHPEPFQAKLDGKKPWEFRKDDRGYQLGDIFHEREWVPKPTGSDPKDGYYTGRTLDELVTFILRGPDFGIPEGFCIMTTERLDCITVPLVTRINKTFDDRDRGHVLLITPWNSPHLGCSGATVLEARNSLQGAFERAYAEYVGGEPPKQEGGAKS